MNCSGPHALWTIIAGGGRAGGMLRVSVTFPKYELEDGRNGGYPFNRVRGQGQTGRGGGEGEWEGGCGKKGGDAGGSLL